MTFVVFQIPQHVEVQLLSTHDTGLQYWGWTKFTVMKSGVVVLWGKTSEQTPAAFHLYNNTSTGFTKIREVKGLCEHDFPTLLPVTMNNTEFLAVACPACHMIRLLNLETEEVTVAFHDQRVYPAVMSHGEGDVIYLVHSVKGLPVLELNTGRLPFSKLSRTIQSGMETYYSMHYIPSPHRLIVLTWWKDSMIRAVSAETGEKVWDVMGELDGRMIQPHSLLFSAQHQVLLVADGSNNRLLVLHPRDGSHLQTIQLDQYMGVMGELCLLQNKLVHHHAGSKEKVSYFSIN